ncbi:uncharacterized protein LOC122376068 [Amphibalanus amphitrite]|uniref:uncharacterized protein LOC122376068 n=1 Tax=Amphibalanus amphitrite TaxID=1232801 RepID=UPI001C9051F9|nr:uncharacterized protein LOC122376068 [Amphibalanus amphitrite]XP_043211679.1 uncharacterized protein LOC122376068 [Amphibalanus amphitrite]
MDKEDVDEESAARSGLPAICRAYSAEKGGCMHPNCPALHLCLSFVLHNKCKAGCDKEHTLGSSRNISLLEQAGWDVHHDLNLAMEELRKQEYRNAFGVCMRYNLGRCATTRCTRLHICYRYVLDDCPLEVCNLSHKLKSVPHNAKLLRAADWSTEPDTTLLLKLRESCSPPKPEVCKMMFSRPSGCEGHCMRLHCCEQFTRGNCRYGDKCKLIHDLHDDEDEDGRHNQRVLSFFGWSVSEALEEMVVRRQRKPPRRRQAVMAIGDDDGKAQ